MSDVFLNLVADLDGAPLVVKGKVFVGISGGEGLRARAEQSEPLSGSANAMLSRSSYFSLFLQHAIHDHRR